MKFQAGFTLLLSFAAISTCAAQVEDASKCLAKDNSCLFTGSTKTANSEDTNDENTLNLCVGIRGNGNWIYSHYPSLARIVEEIGTIDGAAGGSSASVSTYILESIQSNPLIMEPALCDMERRARTSFLLKSVEAMDEQLNIANPFTDRGAEAMEFLKESNILERLAEGGTIAEEAVAELVTYLGTTLVAIGNPEFFALVEELAYDPDLQARTVADILNSLMNQLESVDSPTYFVRPIPFSMAAASPIHDAVGSFYAGYQPVVVGEFEYMLEQCASPGLGKAWDEVKAILAEDGRSCGELFIDLAAKFIENREGGQYPSRLDEPLGTEKQTSLIAVAVLRDQGIDEYNEAKMSYFNGNLNSTWDMSFDDVHFGYWGDGAVLERAEEGIVAFDDLKSSKADFIGQTTWRDILIRSPGEPGLSNGIEGTDANGEAFVSIGGWPDLTPTQILKAVGCEKVVLVSRHVGTSDFQFSIESVLGATEQELTLLNDLDSASSSWSNALSLSDGSLCADYIDEVDGTVDKIDLTRIGWAGPFVTDNECLTSLLEDAPDMLPTERFKRACHHGKSAPSTLSAGDSDALSEEANQDENNSSEAGNLRRQTFSLLNTTLILAVTFSIQYLFY